MTIKTTRPRNPLWIAGAAGGGFAVVATIVTVGLALHARATSETRAAAAVTTVTDAPLPRDRVHSASVTAAHGETDHAPSPNELPVVSVDALPGASAKPQMPVPQGAGRLLVAAGPGWCALVVDGKERGPTPAPSIDLPPGSHHLECRTMGGRVKTATVTIQEGATSRYRFALDD
jgi:hypothetical protein